MVTGDGSDLQAQIFQRSYPTTVSRRMFPGPDGETNIYMGRDGWSVYAITWITAPSLGETDEDAIAVSLEVFLKGVGQGFQKRQ